MNPTPALLPPVTLRRYPHMHPADAHLWEQFLLSNPFPHAKIAYDLHVGTPATLPPDTAPQLRKMAYALSTRRIDAVAYLPDETIIIEVKPNAGITAIGQVLSYTPLFHREHPLSPKPIPAIVTDTAQPDIPWLCTRYRILLIELNPIP